MKFISILILIIHQRHKKQKVHGTKNIQNGSKTVCLRFIAEFHAEYFFLLSIFLSSITPILIKYLALIQQKSSEVKMVHKRNSHP